MYSYQLQQWLLFFFIYCFIGWCWESAYVSAKKREWVNRGFLKGPFLPIYGFGALAVLVSTLPFRPYPLLVCFFGMLGATLLELVTGICMEKLFHVRYWDYSNQKFNFKGHICLSSSVAWGFFSLAMIYGFHKPIEGLVLLLPDWLTNLFSLVLTAAVAGDFAVSFKTAMELRDILDGMERIKSEMKRLQKRAEVIEAFLADSAEKKTEELRTEMRERREDVREELHQIRERQQQYLLHAKSGIGRNISVEHMLKRNPGAVSSRYAAAFREYKDQIIAEIREEIQERRKK